MMHTPIWEGLNLCPLKYIYARKEPADPGAVIASEFSAVSSILNGALRVNPYDIHNFVTSINNICHCRCGGRWPIATTSALALVVVCGVNGPSTSDTEGAGRREGHRGWSAMDKEAAATSQKWQWCPKNKV